jgi:hypothetical protein
MPVRTSTRDYPNPSLKALAREEEEEEAAEPVQAEIYSYK